MFSQLWYSQNSSLWVLRMGHFALKEQKLLLIWEVNIRYFSINMSDFHEHNLWLWYRILATFLQHVYGQMGTCADGVTRLVHPADEKLQTDDGVDDDDEHDQHTDVQKGDHGFHDGVQHNLQTWQTNTRWWSAGTHVQMSQCNTERTWHSRYEPKRS